MKRKSLSGLLLLAIILTGMKVVVNHLQIGPKGSPEDYSWSIAEAREKGTFLCELVPEPTRFDWQGATIQFNECWIEKRHIEDYALVWIRTRRSLAGYNICFTLSQGEHLIRGVAQAPSFFLDAASSGFMSSSIAGKPVLFSYMIPDKRSESFRLSLSLSGADPKTVTLRKTTE